MTWEIVGALSCRQLLTFLVFEHYLLFLVARAAGFLSCAFHGPAGSCCFCQRVFVEWGMLLQHFLWSWQAFIMVIPSGSSFSGNTDFPGMLLYLGSPLYQRYCGNIGFSNTMTLLCSYREIQKQNCSLRMTGRETRSSHLSWLVSFSCFSKNQDESY